MKLSELTPGDFRHRLAQGELALRCGPVINRLKTRIPLAVEALALAYGDFPVVDGGYADFHIELTAPSGLRGRYKPQVNFIVDGERHFQPLPYSQAYPMLEWGLNWCVTSQCHRWLILHAAVLARNGRALILPGEPGAGKSTLTALLSHLGGWRLLSDEQTILVPETGEVLPIPRPISLKNQSIDVVRHWIPQARITEPVQDTGKGVVAHVKPPAEAVAAMADVALPAWIVFPRYQAGVEASLDPVSPGNALLRLVDQSFNYQLHGERGFECLADLVGRCPAFEFHYSAVADALAVFARLAEPAGESRERCG